MASATAKRMAPDQLLKILILLSALFFLLVGFTVYRLSAITPAGVGVPLKPCKQCVGDCPCPRLSGAIRCSCPQ